MSDLFVGGLVAHLIADWFLQNEWQAVNKVSLKHPAAWVHSGLHLLALLLVFWWPVAVGLAVAHLLIDTRVPLAWWRRTTRQTTEGPMAPHVAVWQDQAAHLICLAIGAWLAPV